MALITEIIKKYDGEAKSRIAEARKMRDTQRMERESLFLNGAEAPKLNTSTSEPTQQDFAYFDWQNKLVDAYRKLGEVNVLLDQLQQNTGLLKEMERIRKENTELKHKLNSIQP